MLVQGFHFLLRKSAFWWCSPSRPSCSTAFTVRGLFAARNSSFSQSRFLKTTSYLFTRRLVGPSEKTASQKGQSHTSASAYQKGIASYENYSNQRSHRTFIHPFVEFKTSSFSCSFLAFGCINAHAPIR